MHMEKALAFAVAATTLLSAGASADSVDDGNAVFMMNEVMKENGTDRNLVFSPYSVQQILASIGANSHDQRLEKELAPYTVPGIRWETLKIRKQADLFCSIKISASPIRQRQVAIYESFHSLTERCGKNCIPESYSWRCHR